MVNARIAHIAVYRPCLLFNMLIQGVVVYALVKVETVFVMLLAGVVALLAHARTACTTNEMLGFVATRAI